MATFAQLLAAGVKWITNADLAVAITQGPATGEGSTVLTENGYLPTFAKMIADLQTAQSYSLRQRPVNALFPLRANHTNVVIPSKVMFPIGDSDHYETAIGFAPYYSRTLTWDDLGGGEGKWVFFDDLTAATWEGETVDTGTPPIAVATWTQTDGPPVAGTLSFTQVLPGNGTVLNVLAGDNAPVPGPWFLADAEAMLWLPPGSLFNNEIGEYCYPQAAGPDADNIGITWDLVSNIL